MNWNLAQAIEKMGQVKSVLYAQETMLYGLDVSQDELDKLNRIQYCLSAAQDIVDDAILYLDKLSADERVVDVIRAARER